MFRKMKLVFRTFLLLVIGASYQPAEACSTPGGPDLAFDPVAPRSVPGGTVMYKIQVLNPQDKITNGSPGDVIIMVAKILEGPNLGQYLAIPLIAPACGYIDLPIAGIGYIIGQYHTGYEYTDQQIGKIPLFIRRYRPDPSKFEAENYWRHQELKRRFSYQCKPENPTTTDDTIICETIRADPR
jgi:hypothetical protein